MVDHLSSQKRSWNMSKIRSNNTRPEMIVRRLLHSLGFRFRLHRKDLPGKPDIVLPKFMTVIFIHGCFWHRHSGCARCTTPKSNLDYWEQKFQKNIQRDHDNQSALIKAGWNVLVIWECETKDTETLQKNIVSFLQI
ncbi:MAG: DNA mismatch endonuclease Vsr [Candidatus Auribacterota bacterium]